MQGEKIINKKSINNINHSLYESVTNSGHRKQNTMNQSYSFNSISKRLISILLTISILFTFHLYFNKITINAATKYITINDFIEQLVQAMKLEVNMTSMDPYIDTAIVEGILNTGEFTDYNSYITRTDAAVLLNRADEKLHGDTVEAKQLEFVLTKRLSDIKKIDQSKREAVAKIYAKGIIKGYSNGMYIQNREFRGDKKLTAKGAKTVINLLLNPIKRAQVSPDGQLIRTTDLPKNAENFDYILECFPNRFYEKKFEFMFKDTYIAGVRRPDTEIYPIDMKNSLFKNWIDKWPFSIEMDKHLYTWTDMAEKYLNYIFNVDYRTVDDEWIEGLASLYVRSNINEADDIRTYYIDDMKKNKVIVESSIIAVEPSTLYYDGDHCMRAFVRYRITAKDINVKRSKLLYAQYPTLLDLKSGEWREGIFDIRFGSNNGYSGDGSDFAIETITYFKDTFNKPIG